MNTWWNWIFRIQMYNRNIECIPSANRINCRGGIYILQDEECFSSSLALLSVVNQYPEIFTTVGLPNKYISGKGVTPFYFLLPNSKISYRLNSSLDITDCKKIEDVFKITQPQIQLNPSYESFMQYFDYEADCSSEEYLFKKDFMFKKVLELKQKDDENYQIYPDCRFYR